ncbi:MAG: UDP-N-acetylmuramate dehydrogenase [Raineya sp.]
MLIEENVSLKKYHTFGIDVKARYLIHCSHIHDICDAIHFQKNKQLPLLVLGGGSNLLFTEDFKGVVVKINLLGKEKIRETDNYVWVKAAAGENWDEFVQYCIANNLGGLENLSLIPGTVGAAPMQNIGAYGVEIKQTFYYLDAFHIDTGQIHRFGNKECNFGYRESIFKNEVKNRYVIVSVVFRLSKNHQLNVSYGDIQAILNAKRLKPTIANIGAVVSEIRRSKLPNPAEIGNAGSFFKNPYVEKKYFEKLKMQYPSMPSYPTHDENWLKVPAAWLIENCGWKGYREGDVGVHSKQALVLVNYGNAKGKEIANLSEKIKKSVAEKFGIALHTEVNII